MALLGSDAVQALCRERIETVRFWQWFYTSPVVAAGAARLGFATLPAVVRDQVLGRLLNQVQCAGSPALAAEEQQAVPAIGTSTLVPVLDLFRSAYAVVDPSVDLEYNGASVPSASTTASASASGSRSVGGASYLRGLSMMDSLDQDEGDGFDDAVGALRDILRATGSSDPERAPRDLQFSNTETGTSEAEALGAALTFGHAASSYLRSGDARFALLLRPPATSWSDIPGARISTATAIGLPPSAPAVFPGANVSLISAGSPADMPGYAALTHQDGDAAAADGSTAGTRFQSLVLPVAVVGVAPVYSVSAIGST